MISMVWGQATNPAPQSMPYTQDFSALAHTATAYPAGWQGWQLAGSPGADFKTTVAASDRALLASSTAATTSGGAHNYNGTIGALNSSSVDVSLGLALNTTGRQAVTVAYSIMTIRNPYDGGSNTRLNDVTLQYRVGTTGDFITLTGIEYQNNTTTQTTAVTTPQNSLLKSIVLPAACDNQAEIQIRWVSKQVSGGGSRPSFALDNISVTGTLLAGPSIAVLANLTAFTTIVGTPSVAQTYTLSGSNLTGNITITAPVGYAISTNGGVNYAGTGSVASSFNGLIYVRMTGATVGPFSGNIAHASTGATTINTPVSGTVESIPVPMIEATGTLSAFSAYVGSPSAAQSYTLTGTALTSPISITPPAGYVVSTDGGTVYAATGSVAANYNGLIYVRLTGTTLGAYSGNIVHAATGVTSVNLAVTGDVIAVPAAELLMVENFAYTVGTTLVSNGWTAHSGAGTASPLVDAMNLTYTGYPSVTGNSAKLTGVTGEDVNKAFTTQNSGDVYCSFLMNLTTAKTTFDYMFHISLDFKGRLFVQRDATNGIRFGLSKGSTTESVVQFTPYSYALATTYLVVVKYSMIPGDANDIVSLWIDPNFSGAEPTPTLTIGATDTTSDTSGIGAIALRQGSNTPGGYFDGFRVSNSWSLLWENVVLHPVIETTGTLSPFVMIAGVPSERQFYHLSGSQLSANIEVTAPTGFQLSVDGNDPWTSSLSVGSTFDGDIFVRMSAATAGLYSGNITHSSGTATVVNVAVEGEALAPTGVINANHTFTAFTTPAGTPSAVQTYALSGTDLAADLFVTVDAPFQVSVSGQNNWLTMLTLAPTFNGNIDVRLNSASIGNFNTTLMNFSDGAQNKNFALTGEATSSGAAGNLFFSEYVEGGSNRKAVEIFNGTGAAVNLANYTLNKQTNGAGDFGGNLTLTGTLANNDVYVIVLSNATGSLVGEPYVDLATTSSVMSFNGNDCVALYHNGVQIDVIGIVNQVTPNWGADVTFVRMPNITAPRTDWTLAEWISYPIDTVEYLGSHNFTPGVQLAATPTFAPPAGLYFSTTNVTIATTTPAATIRYTIDGTDPTMTVGTIYSGPVAVSANTTLKAVAYATGFTVSPVASAVYSFPINVSNIAALRAQTTGTQVYTLTGPAVLTYQRATRNQKYIKDTTAAILIDDAAGIITTTYNVGDGITGISGTLTSYAGLLQFVPVINTAAATSTGNAVVPEVRTLASLTSADQAKLIKVLNVNFTTPTGAFAESANYPITDPSGAAIFRTGFTLSDGANYIGTDVPTTAKDIVCFVGQYNADMQITPRTLADFTDSVVGTLDMPVVTIVRNGANVELSWPAVSGATNYRLMASDDPYTGFTLVVNTANTTYTTAAGNAKKFYKVIATN
jgi:hypothetical protein